MGDLYNRLDELQAVTRVLSKDVQFYREQCNRTEPQEIDSLASANHRAYVRAVFALIEALIEQHKGLLLDLHDSGVVAVDPKLVDRLREQERFMRLKDKVKTIYKAAGIAFGQKPKMDCASAGWRALAAAIKTRDRVTHPKCFQECSVQVWDLDLVQQGEAWFRAMHNEFVRVAREHRTAIGWKPGAPIPTSAAD